MIFIKIFLLLLLTLGFIIFAFSMKLKNFQRLMVIIGYLTLFIFILNPALSDKVANFFGIDFGASLITYIAIGVLSLVNVILFVDTKINKDAITKIIREGAIKDARKI